MRTAPTKPVSIVMFHNFSNQPFSWMWDKVQYDFDPGQTVHMEDWKAEHFTKHLVDREMNRLGVKTDDFGRRKLEKKCITIPEKRTTATTAGELSKLETELANKGNLTSEMETTKPRVCEKCDSKGVTNKKDC